MGDLVIARIVGVLIAIHPVLPAALAAAALYGSGRAVRALTRHTRKART